jgi:hypothetical protein
MSLYSWLKLNQTTAGATFAAHDKASISGNSVDFLQKAWIMDHALENAVGGIQETGERMCGSSSKF